MLKESILNPDLAEAIFYYCLDPEELDDDDRKHLVYDNLSMAEFVAKYKLKEFSRWYQYRYMHDYKNAEKD